MVEIDNTSMNIQIKWFYRLGFILLLFIVIFVFYLLRPIWIPVLRVIFTALSPFLIAGFISYLLHPLVEWVHKRGVHRGLAIALIYLLFFGLVGYAIYKGLPLIIEQMEEIVESTPQLVQKYHTMMRQFHAETSQWPLGLHEKFEQVIDNMENHLDQVVTAILSRLNRVADFFLLIALIPFISFYLLKDIGLIKKRTYQMIPNKWREQSFTFIRDVDQSLGGYIRGQLLVCVLIAFASAVLLWSIKMDYPLVLSVIIGITNVIPYFGPFIGAVPAVFLAAIISVKMVIKVVIIVLVLQFIEGNVLSPMIMGKSLHLHPLLIILAISIGGEIGGMVGLILAVPLLAILKVCFLHGQALFNKNKQESS